MSAWSPLLRRAGRLARRAPARTASTGGLVFVAVAVATVFLSAAWGDHVRDRAPERTFGAADAIYSTGPGVGSRSAAATVAAAMPDGAEIATVEQSGNVIVAAGGENAAVVAHAAWWESPTLDGLLALVDGAAPTEGQVVVPADLAERLGVDVGDRVDLTGSGDVEVSGIGEVGRWGPGAIALPDGSLDALGGTGADTATTTDLYVALPPGATAPSSFRDGSDEVPLAPALRGAEVAASSGFGPIEPPPPLRTLGGILGLAALVVAVTAGAAFGIGAARRRRAAGILAANGAEGRELRIAIACEALVVALPAALLGVLVGPLLPRALVSMRWPLWSTLVDAAAPWAWLLGLVVVAAAASVLGALVTGRSLASTTTSALLDERSAPRRSRAARLNGWWFVLLGVVGLSAFQFFGRLTAGSSLAVLAGMLLWVSVAAVAVAIGRAVLRRDVVGRLVASDLRRRPVGSVAAVVVVSAWVFLAVVATATDGFRFPAELDAKDLPTAGPDAGVLIHAVAGSELPADLSAELADAGLSTAPAVLHRWTGECAACPDGWAPSVAVLETAEGAGLPDLAVAALASGAAVTGWNMPGIDGSTIGDVPVVAAPVSLGVDALVLRSTIGEGSALVDPAPALLGGTSDLSTSQVARVAAVLDDPLLDVSTTDAALDRRLSSRPGVAAGLPDWVLVGLLVLLVLVTLAATAAHRREHGEAAWVLRVLGGGPREGRRLASITAGALASVGVALGLSAALLTLGGSAARQDGDDRFLGLWNRSASVVLVVALLVPVLVAGLARLLPTYRTAGDPRRLGPC